METILALDPGITTGYCFGTYSDRKLYLIPGQRKFALWELHQQLTKICDIYGTHIIYEDFAYRNASRSGLDLTPVKMIGIIEMHGEYADLALAAYAQERVHFNKQTAADGKAFYSDTKLKDLGVYVKGLKHGMDATRHLLHWATFKAGAAIIDMQKDIIELDLQRWTLDAFHRERGIDL